MSEKVYFAEEIDIEDFEESVEETNPILKTLTIIGDKWNILILSTLLNNGQQSLETLSEFLSELNANSLSAKLEKLEEHGIITKITEEGTTQYSLTESGDSLKPLLSEMKDWGKKSSVKSAKGSSVTMASGKTIKPNRGKIKIR